MSRFLVITYVGDRPPSNDMMGALIEAESLTRLQQLLRHALPFQSISLPREPAIVGFKSPDAEEKLQRFEYDLREAINAAGQDESLRQAYNRAHLKAYKVAALLAIADRHIDPQIDLGHVTWGISIVKRDIEQFAKLKQSGDIGVSDTNRLRKLVKHIQDYFTTMPPPGYHIPGTLRAAGIVPRKYLQQRTSSDRAFLQYRAGATAALDMTIRSLVDDGYIVEVDKHQLLSRHSLSGKAYYVQNLEVPT